MNTFGSFKGVAESVPKKGSGASADMQDKYRIMDFGAPKNGIFLGWRVNGWRRCWSEAMFLVGSSRSSLASARIETDSATLFPYGKHFEELTRISAN